MKGNLSKTLCFCIKFVEKQYFLSVSKYAQELRRERGI